MQSFNQFMKDALAFFESKGIENPYYEYNEMVFYLDQGKLKAVDPNSSFFESQLKYIELQEAGKKASFTYTDVEVKNETNSVPLQGEKEIIINGQTYGTVYTEFNGQPTAVYAKNMDGKKERATFIYNTLSHFQEQGIRPFMRLPLGSYVYLNQEGKPVKIPSNPETEEDKAALKNLLNPDQKATQVNFITQDERDSRNKAL